MFDNVIVEYLIANCHICPEHGVIRLNGSGEGNHIIQIRERIYNLYGIGNVDYDLICRTTDKLLSNL